MEQANESRAVLLAAAIAIVVLILFVVSLGAVLIASSTGANRGSARTLVNATAAPYEPVATATSVTGIAAATGATPPATATTPPATITASSTATASPTATTISSTPTATATATAALAATSAATVSSTATPVPTGAVAAGTAKSVTFVEDHFDSPNSGWPNRDRQTWSAGYAGGRYQITLRGQPTAGVSTVFAADNYRLSADVAVDSGAAGLVFGSVAPATFYRIIIRPDGSFALQRQRQGDDTAVNFVGWTRSPALRPGPGAHNLLRIERRGAALTFYANDQQLARWSIPSPQFNNQYGFALAEPGGTGHATFDDLIGVRLEGS